MKVLLRRIPKKTDTSVQEKAYEHWQNIMIEVYAPEYTDVYHSNTENTKNNLRDNLKVINGGT